MINDLDHLSRLIRTDVYALPMATFLQTANKLNLKSPISVYMFIQLKHERSNNKIDWIMGRMEEYNGVAKPVV